MKDFSQFAKSLNVQCLCNSTIEALNAEYDKIIQLETKHFFLIPADFDWLLKDTNLVCTSVVEGDDLDALSEALLASDQHLLAATPVKAIMWTWKQSASDSPTIELSHTPGFRSFLPNEVKLLWGEGLDVNLKSKYKAIIFKSYKKNESTHAIC